MIDEQRRDEIEKQARGLRRLIWETHLAKRGAEVPQDRYELVEPQLAAAVLGFDYVSEDYLGKFGERGSRFEVAGAYNREQKVILVSTRFPPEEVRFTGAHEIGHVILHPQHGPLHRDRPVSRSGQTNPAKPVIEQEADYFAACFLIPERLLKREFNDRFGSRHPFELDEAAAFFLHLDDQFEDISSGVKPLVLARSLAATTSFSGEHFHSLAKRFRVSISAMAFRLVEIGVVVP